MNDKEKSPRVIERDVLQAKGKLDKITQDTKRLTYGTSDEMISSIEADVNDFASSVLYSPDDNNNKDLSAKISRRKINNNINNAGNASFETINPDSLYDIIENEQVMDSLQTMIGSHNLQFKQLIQDYEIVKRCIPQVHKVIVSLCNNISNPDSISRNILGVKIPSGTSDNVNNKISEIVKERVNPLISEIINDYLVISVKYLTVVPYSKIADMLSADMPINECAQYIDNLTSGQISSLLESSGEGKFVSNSILNESADYIEMDNVSQKNLDKTKWIKENEDLINGLLQETEFVNGGFAHFKNAILNEAINIRDSSKDDKSMAKIYKRLTSDREKFKNVDNVVDGLLNTDSIKDIKKNVNFKGCHIEKLDPTRVVPFKIRDTIIGYFYVTDKLSKNDTDDMKNSGIMEKINSTIYQRATGQDRGQMIERMIIQTIGDKLVRSINSDFLNDNQEDMDKIYEFVRNNEIHRKAKRVVFFHPDDVVEFRRKEGSVMKNAIFLAKLLILTTLSNVISNVTKGSDRTMYYVKTGLSTDIGGHVNSAIAAIKQSQIRASDIGTINDVFNMVGSKVDLFLPESQDGEKPIEAEVVSGQQIDMNTDFVQYLVRSIIISFGVPSTAIDMQDQVELAKTLSMSNLDIARVVLDAQLELCPSFSKLIRLIIEYELPDFNKVDEVEASMNPPAAVVQEMNRDLIETTTTLGDTLASLLYPEDDTESPFAMRRRLFKLEYFKRSMPTLDWEMIMEVYNLVDKEVKVEERETKLISNEIPEDDSSGGEGDNQSF